MSRFYSTAENIQRLAWRIAFPLFRCSPRHLYLWRNSLLRMFGARIGNGVRIFPSCQIYFPWNLEIGSDVDIGWCVRLYNLGKISIGDRVVISQHAHLCAGDHDYMSYNFELLRTPIQIGNSCWIATDVYIGPGVSVANNNVIAARSVLVDSTEDNSVYAGQPAKKVKHLDSLIRSRR